MQRSLCLDTPIEDLLPLSSDIRHIPEERCTGSSAWLCTIRSSFAIRYSAFPSALLCGKRTQSSTARPEACTPVLAGAALDSCEGLTDSRCIQMQRRRLSEARRSLSARAGHTPSLSHHIPTPSVGVRPSLPTAVV